MRNAQPFLPDPTYAATTLPAGSKYSYLQQAVGLFESPKHCCSMHHSWLWIQRLHAKTTPTLTADSICCSPIPNQGWDINTVCRQQCCDSASKPGTVLQHVPLTAVGTQAACKGDINTACRQQCRDSA
eukprot:1158950-Pelagomonas_calceolata.AAC.5